ncbi:hypothetical protein ACMFMF_009192 [Clarireedia jacksonii]
MKHLVLLVLALTTTTAAIPTSPLPPILTDSVTALINLSQLNAPPPAELQTTNPSGKCAAINNGEAVCCAQQLEGQQPVVKGAAGLLYEGELNQNSVNGIACVRETEGFTCPRDHYELCCRVTALMDVPAINLAMWCQGT